LKVYLSKRKEVTDEIEVIEKNGKPPISPFCKWGKEGGFYFSLFNYFVSVF